MRLSVIIPTLNEGRGIGATLDALRSLDGELELIVADGASSDETVRIAEERGARVVAAPRGRGAQMNAGAAAARGEVLLFLHADTRLPPGAGALIAGALARAEVAGGCFRLSFDRDHWLLGLCAFMSRFPFRFFHYGDQAYFVRAEVFRSMGGFREQPLMEDLDFWLRLRRTGREVVLPSAVVTSARRFVANGTLRQQLRNIALVVLYLCGVSAERAAKMYDVEATDRDAGRLPLRPATMRDHVVDTVRLLWHWVYSNAHNLYNSYFVVRFIFMRRIRGGMLPRDHPWLTGAATDDGGPVWPRNLLFVSPRRRSFLVQPDSDEAIVARVGLFLAAMVARSNAAPEIPQGARRRMPHAVNYLHGSIHYNGGFLLFDDFADAMFHLSDSRFAREIRRFAREERRELTIVLRERRYRPEEYAWFVAFVRSRLPWYANGNGPTSKRVLWGTPSPYAAVNPINGSWIADVQALARGAAPARPPIERGRWFQGTYRGHVAHFSFLVRFHAWVMHLIIAVRGFQGGMVFTPRKRIEPDNWRRYVETSGEWRASYSVPHPFRKP